MARYWVRRLDSGRTHSEVKDIDRLTDQRSRKYVVTFLDGDQICFRNITSLTKKLKSEVLEAWMIEKTLESIRNDWQPNVSYSAEKIEEILTRAEGARRAKMREAGGWGIRTHELIEFRLKKNAWIDFNVATGEQEPLNLLKEHPAVINGVTLFREWLDAQDLEPVAVEQYVVCFRHGFAGTLDFLFRCRKTGKLRLIDWKTGKGVFDDAFLQQAALAMCWHEQFGELPAEGWILHISREGDLWKQIPCWQNIEEARALAKHFLELANKNDLEAIVRQRFKAAIRQHINIETRATA